MRCLRAMTMTEAMGINTLRYRMVNTAAEGNAHAKTGSLTGACR